MLITKFNFFSDPVVHTLLLTSVHSRLTFICAYATLSSRESEHNHNLHVLVPNKSHTGCDESHEACPNLAIIMKLGSGITLEENIFLIYCLPSLLLVLFLNNT